ncbi:hypothetical protein [Cypionkella sp.]|uniref:hypothetical protein n=1 Tax=Cypionkella sp. TaxID=2811411 RepID=UPI002AB872F8|nr:hypothetical protein [Cypionkella sp.]MDZ4391893.1 hypothetical protein [Cypionkella sp.]
MRLCVILLSFLALLGCTPHMLEDQAAANLIVRTVTVDTAAISGVAGRKMAFDVPAAQINADLTQALQRQLRVTPQGNADVTVTVKEVRLMSRMQELMLGGASYVKGTLTVTDAATGRQIVAPTEVFATSQRFRVGGPIGAVVAPTAKDDYLQTIEGFAMNVRVRLSPRRAVEVAADSPAAKAGRAQVAR